MSAIEPIVYFHGLPGGPGELEAVGAAADWSGLPHISPNRRVIGEGSNLSKHFDALASKLKSAGGNSPVTFVGFSLGAYVALEVAKRMGPSVSRINLVSAAAPLSKGNFLPDMAGQMVFRAAQYSPVLLAALTRAQSFALHISPDRLFDALFASAQGMDRELAGQPYFRASIIDVLNECFNEGAKGYRLELRGYTQDWSQILPQINQPVELWHGNLDNWAPPSMADALADALPNARMIHRLEGHSHYSTLQAYIEGCRTNAWPH